MLALTAGEAQAQTVECNTANADGSYNARSDWPLIPSGLAVGAKFRLLFVTSARTDAGQAGISHYNSFVQTRAKAGHMSISDSCGDAFRVIGSTTTVNARTNTQTGASDTDAAIYWLGGDKAADNYADLYDGSWDSNARRSESGTAFTVPEGRVIWTGTNPDGTPGVLAARELLGDDSSLAVPAASLALNGTITSVAFINDEGQAEFRCSMPPLLSEAISIRDLYGRIQELVVGRWLSLK